jgi:hypothetical protein
MTFTHIVSFTYQKWPYVYKQDCLELVSSWENVSTLRVLEFLFPSPPPQRKNIHNPPKNVSPSNFPSPVFLTTETPLCHLLWPLRSRTDVSCQVRWSWRMTHRGSWRINNKENDNNPSLTIPVQSHTLVFFWTHEILDGDGHNVFIGRNNIHQYSLKYGVFLVSLRHLEIWVIRRWVLILMIITHDSWLIRWRIPPCPSSMTPHWREKKQVQRTPWSVNLTCTWPVFLWNPWPETWRDRGCSWESCLLVSGPVQVLTVGLGRGLLRTTHFNSRGFSIKWELKTRPIQECRCDERDNLFIMKWERESWREDLYMRVGVMRD